jgi:hypothetical protein
LAVRLTSTNFAKLLFILSEAEKSLGEGDPTTAQGHFKTAGEAFNSVISKDDSDASKEGHQHEQRSNTLDGLARCKIKIVEQAGPSLSSEAKRKHLKDARYFATKACEGQNHDPKNCTLCEVLKLVKRKEWQFR